MIKRISVNFFLLLFYSTLAFSQFVNPMNSNKELTMLCLGDSYTIGEKVDEPDRFPNQTILTLHAKGIYFEKPRIIATTGWTTDELSAAIQKEKIITTYDFVTLLIGVNNQYRGRSADEYREQFSELLQQAIKFSGNHKDHVIILSIPDWGATPFAEGKNRQQIASEIDLFNKINKEESEKQQVHYIDITPISRKIPNDDSLVAADGLHPSGKMYAEWAAALAKVIEDELK
jgi:lysophospholipase L1-like esterase